MKRILLFLLLQVTFLVCFADEYIDPVSNVIYTYNPSGNRAEVKQGEEWIDTDDGQSGWSQPGSPNAKTEIVILERFTVDGKEYVVDKIGDYAFFQMKNITSIVIPSSVKTIGCNAFKECSALSCVVINNGLTSINELAFAECESLESISLPETLKEIGPKAFHSCTSLTSVIIPEGVTNISNHAFAYCDNLEDIYCRAESVPTTDVEAFFGTPIASATLHVPEGSIEKYKATSPWKEFREIVTLEEEQAKLIICVTNNDETSPIDTLYTEDEILWFNDSTREIKFMYSDEEVREKLRSTRSNSKYLEFRLGENVLLKATVTSNVMSHIITDLVLCMGSMERRPYSYAGFFLYDCYPLNKQAINDERTQTNIQKRAPQWEIFLKHWESKGKLRHDPIDLVSFSQGKRATIILPTTPDASKGKYYRLDRWENGKIIFEEEPNPQARTPYIIVPKEDFSIDLNALDLDGLLRDTVSVKGASFIGSYCHEELSCQDGFYIDIIDATPDCQADNSNQRKAIVGALRACLIVSWDDPYNQGGSRGVPEKRELVLKDNPNGIGSLTPNPSPSEKGTIYDLSGRKVNSQFSIFNSQFRKKGLYIQNGVKRVVR